MRLSFFQWVLLGLSLLGAGEMNGQSTLLKHYGVDDGLPTSLIYCAVQDEKGYIWFATEMGLSKFDGYTFKNFTIADGLLFNDITDLYLDSQQRIWLSGFGEQAVYLKNGIIYKVDWPSEFASNAANNIFEFREDQSGNLWAFNGRQMTFLLGDHAFETIETTGTGRIIDCPLRLTDFSGPIVISENDDGVYLWQTNAKQKRFEQLRQVMSKAERAAAPLARYDLPTWLDDKGLLFFDDAGVFRKNENGWTKLETCLPTANKIESNYYRVIPISENYYFVKTRTSQFITDADLNCLPNISFLTNLNVARIFQDANRNLWLLTKDNGVYFKAHHDFESESKVENLIIDEAITAMDMDADGTLWVGTQKGNLFFKKKTHDRPIAHTKGASIEKDLIRDLQCNEERIDLVINQHGALSFDYEDLVKLNWEIPHMKVFEVKDNKRQLKSKTTINGSSFQVTNFSPKSSMRIGDTLYLASGAGLIAIIEKGEQYYISKLTDRRCYSVASNPVGGIWIGQPDGLFSINRSHGYKDWASEKLKWDILKQEIRDMEISRDGSLWVATDGYGVYQFKQGQVYTFPELGHKIVKSVHIDDADRIWLSTNEGLLLMQQNKHGKNIKRITTTHGLLSNEVNCVIVDDQKIYVGTSKGLSYIDYPLLDQPAFSSPLNVERILVNGKERNFSNHYTLKHFENRLAIEYISPSMESNGRVTYEYKMEGVDTSWQSTKEMRQEYAYLAAGSNYNFKLRARDVNDNPAKQEYEIRFEIRNPWWKNPRLLLLIFLMISALLFFLVRSRFKKLKEENRKENEHHKKMAELELQALQSQMNPHFIFNALQAIQELVTSQDIRSANRYLSSFSQLMRLFLESSKEKYISLEDEISLLENYVMLEQLRFDPPFEFRKSIASNISSSTVEIPSMLLQPFVENAINHGLKYKSGKGLLILEVREEYETLKIRIIDNGVGRKRSEEIQNMATRSYKSRAISITKQRLETIRSLEEMNVKINIKDGILNGETIGTEVQIEISLMD